MKELHCIVIMPADDTANAPVETPANPPTGNQGPECGTAEPVSKSHSPCLLRAHANGCAAWLKQMLAEGEIGAHPLAIDRLHDIASTLDDLARQPR